MVFQVVIIKSEEINMVCGHNIECAEKCLQIDLCEGMVEKCLCIVTQILTHRCFRSFSLLLFSIPENSEQQRPQALPPTPFTPRNPAVRTLSYETNVFFNTPVRRTNRYKNYSIISHCM